MMANNMIDSLEKNTPGNSEAFSFKENSIDEGIDSSEATSAKFSVGDELPVYSGKSGDVYSVGEVIGVSKDGLYEIRLEDGKTIKNTEKGIAQDKLKSELMADAFEGLEAARDVHDVSLERHGVMRDHLREVVSELVLGDDSPDDMRDQIMQLAMDMASMPEGEEIWPARAKIMESFSKRTETVIQSLEGLGYDNNDVNEFVIELSEGSEKIADVILDRYDKQINELYGAKQIFDAGSDVLEQLSDDRADGEIDTVAATDAIRSIVAPLDYAGTIIGETDQELGELIHGFVDDETGRETPDHSKEYNALVMMYNTLQSGVGTEAQLQQFDHVINTLLNSPDDPRHDAAVSFVGDYNYDVDGIVDSRDVSGMIEDLVDNIATSVDAVIDGFEDDDGINEPIDIEVDNAGDSIETNDDNVSTGDVDTHSIRDSGYGDAEPYDVDSRSYVEPDSIESENNGIEDSIAEEADMEDLMRDTNGIDIGDASVDADSSADASSSDEIDVNSGREPVNGISHKRNFNDLQRAVREHIVLYPESSAGTSLEEFANIDYDDYDNASRIATSKSRIRDKIPFFGRQWKAKRFVKRVDKLISEHIDNFIPSSRDGTDDRNRARDRRARRNRSDVEGKSFIK